MAEVCVLMVPSLRSSMAKAASLIVEADYDVVFINFPYNLQSIVLSYASEHLSLNDLVNVIKSERLIPEPINTWLYLNQPILETLPTLQKRNAKIYCYRDVDNFHMSMENATKIANLTLKVNVTGKVDVEEWIKTVMPPLNLSSTDLEAEFIGFKAEGKSVCITGIFGWKLAKRIKGFGHKVSVKCVEKRYYMRPVETFEILLERGKLTPQNAEQLIKEHAKFVRDYVLNTGDIDEAYFTWLGRHKLLNQNAKA
ncbi:MAG: hypothetical protein RMJ15_09100 [Nitrososphaerota archaeon]|nr:hypothetical protein [Candidatus Bathyarchaeota archaeon]MDW8023873.1 hypothetical protein [Nitrososphaerota archaeon]